MNLAIYPGRTLHLPKHIGATPHLWIVLTTPKGISKKVVIVNLTSFREGCDSTVVLKVGEHRFIKYDTVVRYTDARFAEVKSLQTAIANDRLEDCNFDEDCNCHLLKKIQKGLLLSPFTNKEIKEYCKSQFSFNS